MILLTVRAPTRRASHRPSLFVFFSSSSSLARRRSGNFLFPPPQRSRGRFLDYCDKRFWFRFRLGVEGGTYKSGSVRSRRFPALVAFVHARLRRRSPSPPVTTNHHRSPPVTTGHHRSPPVTTGPPLVTTSHHLRDRSVDVGRTTYSAGSASHALVDVSPAPVSATSRVPLSGADLECSAARRSTTNYYHLPPFKLRFV